MNEYKRIENLCERIEVENQIGEQTTLSFNSSEIQKIGSWVVIKSIGLILCGGFFFWIMFNLFNGKCLSTFCNYTTGLTYLDKSYYVTLSGFCLCAFM